MAVKIVKKCSRCRRDDSVEVASAAAAVESEALIAQREEKAKAVENYLRSIPPELMPDLIAYVKGEGVIHTNLCNPTDAKRSCLKRVGDLVAQMDELDERKPRAKKAKADAPAAA